MYKVMIALAFTFLGKSDLYGQQKADTCLLKPLTNDCLKLLKKYSEYWILDSLATKGFWDLMGTELLSRCQCLEGRNWDELAKFLGKPNFIIANSKFLEKGETVYRYILFSRRGLKYHNDLGSRRLDITVFEGKIRSFIVFETDG